MNDYEIDKREVRRAFSRAAAQYDAAAVLQREVCVRMLEKLDYVKLEPARVLDVGSGTGWGARQLGERYKYAEHWAGGRSCSPAASIVSCAPTLKPCRCRRRA